MNHFKFLLVILFTLFISACGGGGADSQAVEQPDDPIAVDIGTDTDGDGIPDSEDTDDDNDGVIDSEDAFPLDPNESVDTYNDGIGNNEDTDDDNDGVLDEDDEYPLDPNRYNDHDAVPIPGLMSHYLADLPWSSRAGGSASRDVLTKDIYVETTDSEVTEIVYKLNGIYLQFSTAMALTPNLSLKFEVFTDDALIYSSGIVDEDHIPEPLTLDIAGANELTLVVTGGGRRSSNGGYWLDARISGDPELIDIYIEPDAATETTFVDVVSDMSWLDSKKAGQGSTHRNGNSEGELLAFNDVVYKKSIFMRAYANAVVALDEHYHTFKADLAVLDGKNGIVIFKVYLDGELAYESEPVSEAEATILLNLDVTGAREMMLEVNDAGGGLKDSTAWGNALLIGDIPVADYDLDGIVDVDDSDSDNDGVEDLWDDLPFDQMGSVDSDKDGFRDSYDLFPDDATNGKTFQLQHPGSLISQEQVDAIKAEFDAGNAERLHWHERLVNYKYQEDDCFPPEHMPEDVQTVDGACSGIALSRYVMDYILTDNLESEAKAIAILNRWGNVKSAPKSKGWQVRVGNQLLGIWSFADLLRSYGTVWSQEDQDKFSEMTRNIYLPMAREWSISYTGNIQLGQGGLTLAMAVWLDDSELFVNTLRHFYSGQNTGRFSHYFLPNGQTNESTRDQCHALMGLRAAQNFAQIAWTQGFDLWEGETYSMARAGEWTLLYNKHLEDDVPFQKHGRGQYRHRTVVSDICRGTYPELDLIYHHYQAHNPGSVLPKMEQEMAASSYESAQYAPTKGHYAQPKQFHKPIFFRNLFDDRKADDAVDATITLISEQIEKRPILAFNFGGGLLDAESVDIERGVAFVAARHGKYADMTNSPTFSKPDIYIADTNTSGIYRTQAYGPQGETVSVFEELDNGTYTVRLHFAEIERRFPGARKFDVLVEGVKVADDLDVAAEVGPQAAYILEVPATITDGILNVDLKRHDWDTTDESYQAPMIAALEAIKLD